MPSGIVTGSPSRTETSRETTGGGAGGNSGDFRFCATVTGTLPRSSSQQSAKLITNGRAETLTVAPFYWPPGYLGNAASDYLIAPSGPAFLERAPTMMLKRAVLCLVAACSLLADVSTAYGQAKLAP